MCVYTCVERVEGNLGQRVWVSRWLGHGGLPGRRAWQKDPWQLRMVCAMRSIENKTLSLIEGIGCESRANFGSAAQTIVVPLTFVVHLISRDGARPPGALRPRACPLRSDFVHAVRLALCYLGRGGTLFSVSVCNDNNLISESFPRFS